MGYFIQAAVFSFLPISFWERDLNPFVRTPKSLPILNSSKFVPPKGFPVVKALSSQIVEPLEKVVRLYRSMRPTIEIY